MTSEGKYVRDSNYQRKNAFNSQEYLIARAARRMKK